MIFLAAAFLTILLAWREPAAVQPPRRVRRPDPGLGQGDDARGPGGRPDLIFLGIEILSVALYVLCALEVWRERSLESGLKYLITGAVGASILLYGLALLFGATGSTWLETIGGPSRGHHFHGRAPGGSPRWRSSPGGLAFKASAVPFHMWTPDVYEGAPTTVTAFMSTAVKAAAFAAVPASVHPA